MEMLLEGSLIYTDSRDSLEQTLKEENTMGHQEGTRNVQHFLIFHQFFDLLANSELCT